MIVEQYCLVCPTKNCTLSKTTESVPIQNEVVRLIVEKLGRIEGGAGGSEQRQAVDELLEKKESGIIGRLIRFMIEFREYV